MARDAVSSADPVRIRRATRADLATLREFEQQIVAAERPFDPTLRESGVQYYDIESMLRDDRVCMLVAESAGEAIGCGFARIDAAKPFLRHAREAYLGLMYVDQHHRGRGVNQRLLDELLAWCRERGVEEMRLEVYPGNESARRAYEKAGFRPYMLAMRLAPGD